VRGGTAIAGIVLLSIATGLAGADYWFKERKNPLFGVTEQAMPVPTASPNLPVGSGTGITTVATSTGSGSVASLSSSATTTEPTPSGASGSHVVKKGASLKKVRGPNIADAILSLGLQQAETKEASLLALSAPPGSVQTMVLMQQNDRLALFAWTESDNVKILFSALKDALQMQFSPKVTDLLDETRTQESGPPYDILSFSDPKLSPEKVIFIRVRTRLYEFHVAPAKEATLAPFMEILRK
jgi:hypothetical protein